MQKTAKMKWLIRKPVRLRYFAATPEQREALQPVIEAERAWRIGKMAKKGFQLEATVADVFGVFTRGSAQGTVQLVSQPAEEAVLS